MYKIPYLSNDMTEQSFCGLTDTSGLSLITFNYDKSGHSKPGVLTSVFRCTAVHQSGQGILFSVIGPTDGLNLIAVVHERLCSFIIPVLPGAPECVSKVSGGLVHTQEGVEAREAVLGNLGAYTTHGGFTTQGGGLGV
jgi:hypothetical protein